MVENGLFRLYGHLMVEKLGYDTAVNVSMSTTNLRKIEFLGGAYNGQREASSPIDENGPLMAHQQLS